MSKRDEFKQKFKEKAKAAGDALKNSGSIVGGIKGLFRGYDQISDKPKSGHHGFHGGGFQSGGSGFQSGGSGGSVSGNIGNLPSGGFGSSAGPPGSSKFSGFGNSSSSSLNSTSSASYRTSGLDTNLDDFYNDSGSKSSRSKKDKKSKKKKQVSSSESESDSSTEEDSSEDEEARKAREKAARRKARKERKAAEAAAAEAAAKAARKEARRAKREERQARKTKGSRSPKLSPQSSAAFSVGMTVMYKQREPVAIVGVHTDDVDPYYTVKTQSGREKQTTANNLSEIEQKQVCESNQGHDFCGGLYKTDLASLQQALRTIRNALGAEWVQATTERFERIANEDHFIDYERFKSEVVYGCETRNRATEQVIYNEEEVAALPEQVIQGWFQGADRNGDGLIDIREFLLIVAMNEEPLPDTEDILEERASALFRTYDCDKDGVMTLAEVIEMSTFLHKAAGSARTEEEIKAEARQILQLLPTGTFSHGISLASFVKAVKSKTIYQNVCRLIEKGFSTTPKEGATPVCKDTSLDELVDDFGAQVAVNNNGPSSLDDLDFGATPASVASDQTDGSKMDLSAFFSPSNEGASSSDDESSDAEDLLG